MTLIDVARNHSRPEYSIRSLGNARKALAEIQIGLMRPDARGLSDSEMVCLARCAAEIQLALDQFEI